MDVTRLPDDPQQLKALVLQMHGRMGQYERELQVEQQKREQWQRELRITEQKWKSECDAERQKRSEWQQKCEAEQQSREALQDRLTRAEDLLAWFKRKMFGPRSEKINANQLLLFGESILPLTTPAEAKMPAQVKVNRPRHGRRIIPDNLPREIVTIEVPAEERSCPTCGEEREKIGEEVSEQLDFIPAKLFVRRFKREKLACRKGCDASVITAEKPSQPIEKALAGPGLLAHIATSKYADHLPLYRIEGIFARHGIDISRSTMCDWMGQIAQLARPLVKLMQARILLGKVIHSDDTTVPVQDENYKGRTKIGRLWVYVGDAANRYSVFEYTPDRKKEHPQAWLGGYEGYLQADAYPGLDELYLSGKVKEVACWAHARRKFFDAKSSSPAICNEALRRIGLLYDIEREVKDKSAEEQLRARRERSIVVLDEMHTWLMQTRGELLPKNPAAEAITYALNQWEALKRYTEAAYLAIDNNVAEREMRPVAIGRKNWLFAGSDEGGRTAATLSSLIRSATRHGLNVEYYLRSVLAHLPTTKLSELHHLLPDEWKRDLAAEESRCIVKR